MNLWCTVILRWILLSTFLKYGIYWQRRPIFLFGVSQWGFLDRPHSQGSNKYKINAKQLLSVFYKTSVQWSYHLSSVLSISKMQAVWFCWFLCRLVGKTRTSYYFHQRWKVQHRHQELRHQSTISRHDYFNSVNEGMRYFEAWNACMGRWTKGDDMVNDLWLGIAVHNLFCFKRCNTVQTPVRDRTTSDFAGT